MNDEKRLIYQLFNYLAMIETEANQSMIREMEGLLNELLARLEEDV